MSGAITIAVKHLMAAGITGDALLSAISDLENELAPTKTRSPAAIRQQRYRDKKKSETATNRNESATRDENVTPIPSPTPPMNNISNPPTPTPGSITRAREEFPRIDCSSPEVWRDFLKNRKAKRLTNTATAHAKMVGDLAAMAARLDWPPGKVFEACVAKGWGAIYDPRDESEKKNGGNNRNSSGGGDRNANAVAGARAKLASIQGGRGAGDGGSGMDRARALSDPVRALGNVAG